MGFSSFVVFAEMRTGSNFLEEEVNRIDGLTCYGEAFNPSFMGWRGTDALMGIDRATRDADPLHLVRALREGTDGLAGFRFFHDHDSRVFDAVIEDPGCAKIILTRTPLESYVSWKIAQATDQWRLTDAKDRKGARPLFDEAEFAAYLARLRAFRLRLTRALQVRGQVPFHLAYDQIGDAEVMNGLAAWLGVAGRVAAHTPRLKRQNPGALTDKVANPEAMRAALARLDPFALSDVPEMEPRRGPAVPGFVAAPSAPLLYLPLAGGPGAQVEAWLAALDGCPTADLLRGFSQKTLRQWKNRATGGRSFSVISHPAVRLHRAFCRHILATGPERFATIRAALRDVYALPLPEEGASGRYGAKEHRAAFLGFLRFVKSNLAGQTGLRSDPAWASQTALLQGIAEVTLPDTLLREEALADGLARLAAEVGREMVALRPAPAEPGPVPLAEIYDTEVEAAVRDAHNRDFMQFGFPRTGLSAP